MRSVESLASWFVRSCCDRDCGRRGAGDELLLVIPRGEDINRGIENAELAGAFCLRLNEILQLLAGGYERYLLTHCSGKVPASPSGSPAIKSSSSSL